MSLTDKLLKNERLIHIVSEAVVILGITFYFSSKNKQLQNHIDELAQRLEEQEERFAKLENTLTELTKGQKQLSDSSGEMKQFFSNTLYNNIEQIKDLNLRVQDLEQQVPKEPEPVPEPQKPIQRPIQKPVERPVQKAVERPTQKPLEQRPTQKPLEQRPTQKPLEQPVQKPSQLRPAVRIAEQPILIPPPPIEIVFVPPAPAKKASIEEVSESDTESNQEDLSDSELDEEIQEELKDLKKQEVTVKHE